MNSVSFRRDLAVTDEYDVLVVGGGSAGCMAAIQAGRSGARTVLIEKNGILGGTTVVSAVNFPGLFHAWGKQVIKGIGWEVLEEAARRGGAVMPDFDTPYENHRHWEHQILVNKFVYSAILDEFCVKAGVTLRFHEMPADAYLEDDRVHLVVAGKSGLSILRAKTVIDATGDANMAGLMGYERERGEHLQPGTLIYEIGGYRLEDVDQERLAELYNMELAAGRILHTDHLPGAVPFMKELRSRGGNCMHITNIDGADSVSRSTAELKGRASLMRIYEFLRKVPGCEGVQVNFVANECGIRETWRVVGEQRVTLSEYTSGYHWPDAVCHSFYPIDIHRHGDNTTDIRPLRPGVFPTIPMGALIPRGSDRLLVAGRCISGDTEASSAYRVQATCMATGQAAGAAAALAAAQGISVRQVNLDDTLELLGHQGAILPGSLQ
ncbi:FAD-dependent oxidoreductase [Paenibacillus sp. PAMC21692]|uniref:FAD-dependent oxidoreductase n=1 Tax=Paenibacillus sp. PAMC21692 TaxID=2762320 RepID=UPI00164D4173|nr:FAD-dependent oxidoreductase [Paenibacillus sp. PAMC21692]QNK57004.1 FAD-dependent oxidoreductase [Paenibacillus sp. PAMC21692]